MTELEQVGIPWASALAIGAPVAAILAFVLLRIYRRAVLRAMRAVAQVPTATETIGAPADATGHEPLAVVELDASSPLPATGETEHRYRQGQRRLVSAAVIYVCAGAVFLLIDVLAARSVFPHAGGFHPAGALASTGWLLALTGGLVAASTRGESLAIVAGYTGLVLATMVAVAFFRPATSLAGLLADWALEAFGTLILILAFLHRRIRAVGPLVLPLAVFAAAGALASFFQFGGILLATLEAGTDGDVGIIAALLVWLFAQLGAVGLAILLHVIGGAILLALGWVLLRGIGRLYESGRIGAEGLTIDAVWLSMVWMHLAVLAEAPWPVCAAPIAAFVAYKISVWLGFRFAYDMPGPDETGTRLLVLRVFSLGGRSERLFSALAKRWLRIGSITLLAGPDLIDRTVEPHEFLAFLGGRLSRRFVTDEKDLERRLGRQRLTSDPDGRYRISELFCRTDNWQQAVTRLADLSDVIVMDLRSFSPRNDGCRFELEMLASSGALGRAILLVDSSTDREFLVDLLKRSDAVPNRSAEDRGPVARLLSVRGATRDDLRTLLRHLLGIAHLQESRTRNELNRSGRIDADCH